MKDLRTLSADELRRRFASERSGRLVLTRLVRATIEQALGEIRAGREPAVDGNIRTFWYRWLKPIVGRLSPGEVGRKDPYRVMVRELAEMVGVERRFDYRDFGFVDENWENRRIGIGRPQVIVFAEKTGWIRLLRRVHARHDVTVLALGGKPSLLTSEYTARHVALAMTAAGIGGGVSLLALVDWDPDGAIVARSFADQLRLFGLEVAAMELLVRPQRFDGKTLRMLGRDLAQTAAARSWLEDGGGVAGRPVGLSAEAMPATQAEALVAERIEAIAPRASLAVVPRQKLAVAAWQGEIGVGAAGDAMTLDEGRLGEDGVAAVARASDGERTVVTSSGLARAVLVPVERSGVA